MRLNISAGAPTLGQLSSGRMQTPCPQHELMAHFSSAAQSELAVQDGFEHDVEPRTHTPEPSGVAAQTHEPPVPQGM